VFLVRKHETNKGVSSILLRSLRRICALIPRTARTVRGRTLKQEVSLAADEGTTMGAHFRTLTVLVAAMVCDHPVIVMRL